ncbi:MAG: hypothetical protein V7K91_19010 [Nostoc sp.]
MQKVAVLAIVFVIVSVLCYLYLPLPSVILQRFGGKEDKVWRQALLYERLRQRVRG